MAPPRTLPRISGIDPPAFARSVYNLVRSTVEHLHGVLGGGALARGGGSDLLEEAELIARFAAEGHVEPMVLERDGYVDEIDRHVRALGELLGRRPIDSQLGATKAAPVFGLNDEIGVVMLAARARLALLRREPVTCLELAALTEVSPSRIRQMVRAEILHRTEKALPGRAMDRPILYRDAHSLVRQRGVRGFEDRAA